MAKEFECERDGVVIRGGDDDGLVASVCAVGRVRHRADLDHRGAKHRA